MSGSARDRVLGSIRRSVGRVDLATTVEPDLAKRVAEHPRNLTPARTDRPRRALVDLFAEKVESVSGTVARVASMTDVAGAVTDYLASQNLPPVVKAAPDPALDSVDWTQRPLLSVTRGGADPHDETGIAAALVGVAETGTLMLISGPDRPTQLNFLPDTHIVVLTTDQVVATYEDGWDRLRAAGPMPRTVNWITGPSRTGDIEQQLQLGAHGPRRLHVVLVGQDDD